MSSTPPRRTAKSPVVITPGSVVKIISGAYKGKEKTVSKVRAQRYFLRDALKESFGKKVYQINVASSNCKLVTRNVTAREKTKKEK